MSKSTAKTSTQRQSTAKEPVIGVSARAYLSRAKGPTLANITVDLGGEYAIKGLRVVQGRDGPFVAMPQRRTSKGEYQDVVFPVTKEARERLVDTVLDAYEQALEQEAKQSEDQEQAEEPEQGSPAMTM